jgi:hypothetical protein
MLTQKPSQDQKLVQLQSLRLIPFVALLKGHLFQLIAILRLLSFRPFRWKSPFCEEGWFKNVNLICTLRKVWYHDFNPPKGSGLNYEM